MAGIRVTTIDRMPGTFRVSTDDGTCYAQEDENGNWHLHTWVLLLGGDLSDSDLGSWPDKHEAFNAAAEVMYDLSEAIRKEVGV